MVIELKKAMNGSHTISMVSVYQGSYHSAAQGQTVHQKNHYR